MLTQELEARLVRFAEALIDQKHARIVVQPNRPQPGFWFGGGNIISDGDKIHLIGRFRNAGDSRQGLAAGERGLELAVFSSMDGGASFEKVLSWEKKELQVGERDVLSIEGSAIRIGKDRFELFVSSEKTNIGYPMPFASHLKPGAGVWTIDYLSGNSLEELKMTRPETILASDDPCHLHLKDPHLCRLENGDDLLGFCTHPYSWSSSNSAFARRQAGSEEFKPLPFGCFGRGTTWDVAITRVTSVVAVPSVGAFRDLNVKLVFYDGGESLRNLDEHTAAVKRPRGYSCEELGGAAYMLDDDLNRIRRLSVHEPLFVSPYGTGCSRYVSVLFDERGAMATWQQSQDNCSQPLVAHRLSSKEVTGLLS